MSIFRRIAGDKESSLFKDEKIFGMDYFAQDLAEIKWRDKEIEILAREIERVVDGVRIELYIFGTTGIGKTYVTKGVLQEAKKEFKKFAAAWVNRKMIRPLSP